MHRQLMKFLDAQIIYTQKKFCDASTAKLSYKIRYGLISG